MPTKGATGVLRMTPPGGSPTEVGTSMGRGVVRFSAPQRQTSRPTPKGKPATRLLGIYDPVLQTTVHDNAASARLLQGHAGNGRTYAVSWRPDGDGNGKPDIRFNAILNAAATLGAERTRNIRLLATGGLTETTQT